ncbi:DUF2637 domain-containing protein [Streptomyces sp. NBC_01471]|uniref:DUF2637 domain-containing protein n=1 Tax=Streptomyces sp. NBC_01471 TaxID=2903879 RepID=UPI0032521A4E
MTETLTGDQTPATRGAMAGAAPETAGATPAGQAATPATTGSAPPAPRKGGRGWPDQAADPLSTAGATPDAAPATVATPPAGEGGPAWVGRLLVSVAMVGMPLVGIIGFAASYTTLRRVAAENGFGNTGIWSLAPWIPIGIDASIVALLALDLVMVRSRSPWPVLRFAAHAMTLVTVAFNASDGIKSGAGLWAGLTAHPVRVGLHGVMPVLFVLGVEASRHLLIKAARIEDGTASDRVPLHRWVLAPPTTIRLYRQMRLAGVQSYPEMIAREQALDGYKMWLKQKYQGDLSAASEIERLPMKMAPRGYTVDQALALPATWEAEAEKRQRAEEERQEQEAERQRLEAERQREQAKADRIAAIEDEGDIITAQHRQAARTGTAAAEAEAAKAAAESAAATAMVQAEHRRTAAERQAATEAEALESAEVAAARRKTAEDTEAAAKAEAQTQRHRAETAKAEAAANHWIAEAGRLAKEERRVEADRQAAATARYETSLIEARAQQAEDYARLSPRERSERLVARMLLAAGVTPEQADKEMGAVQLSEIMDALNLGQSAASDIRKAAVGRLLDGYRPTEFETAMDSQQS